jgi:hypothetical protein
MPDERGREWADAWVNRIRGEYTEMPGLCLTLQQACRLWGLDRHACEGYLARLVKSGFLARTREGIYTRPS